MLKDFKQFVLRGNGIDLAVAVAIGAAFGAVVTALVEDLITPLIGAIGGQPDFSSLTFTNRLRNEIAIVTEGEMYDPALVRSHWSKHERCSSRAHAFRSMFRHCSQFSLARRAKTFRIANHSLTSGQFLHESLIDEMLQRLEHFASLTDEQVSIRSTDVEAATLVGVFNGNVEG